MAKKSITSIGIEYDDYSIRAAKIGADDSGQTVECTVEALEEVRGDFTKDDMLIKGLRQIKERLAINIGDKVVSCVTGKQVFASQLPFRKLADEEMKNALRFEMRKNLPFEVSASTIDYQVINVPDKKNDRVELMVAVASNALLGKQLKVLEKAGVKPTIVDVLPSAVANSLWFTIEENAESGTAHTALHVGPKVSMVVFDGIDVPYFNRTIYFTAEELFGPKPLDISERERGSRINTFIDEIVRSLSFYEQTYKVSQFGELHLTGNYGNNSELLELLKRNAGINLSNQAALSKTGFAKAVPLGKFDLALALALRAD